MEGRSVTINGRDYISPKGYPKFGFYFDEETKKYSIANLETNEATDPFVDEVFYSELPLRTWTADYVPVRIEELYYLSDNNGTCYFESKYPYAICRNLFVSVEDDGQRYVVTKTMKRFFAPPSDKIIIETHGGYKFALSQAKYGKNKHLLDVYAELVGFYYVISGYKGIETWYVPLVSGEYTFLNNEFQITIPKFSSAILCGEKSQTYKVTAEKEFYYSNHFFDKVKFEQHGEIEIVEYNGETYFFMPAEKEDLVTLLSFEGSIANFKIISEFIIYKLNNMLVIRDLKANPIFYEKAEDISMPKIAGNSIFYRKGETLIKRDFDGNIIEEVKLSTKEVYEFILFESIEEQLKQGENK